MAYWLNTATGVIGSTEQMDADGRPVPGQVELPEDDPRALAWIAAQNRPPPPNWRTALAAATDFADFKQRMMGPL